MRLSIYVKGHAPSIIYLTPGVWRFGRKSESDIVIDSTTVSENHGELNLSLMGDLYVRDLNSTNKIYVNGYPRMSAKLVGGDVLRIGEAVVVVEPEPEGPVRYSQTLPVDKRKQPREQLLRKCSILGFPITPEVIALLTLVLVAALIVGLFPFTILLSLPISFVVGMCIVFLCRKIFLETIQGHDELNRGFGTLNYDEWREMIFLMIGISTLCSLPSIVCQIFALPQLALPLLSLLVAAFVPMICLASMGVCEVALMPMVQWLLRAPIIYLYAVFVLWLIFTLNGYYYDVGPMSQSSGDRFFWQVLRDSALGVLEVYLAMVFARILGLFGRWNIEWDQECA